MNHTEPFVFYTERRLVALTGLRARNLPQLLEHLRAVPGSSIFYHTHHVYLSHHFETPVFTNDFALWTSEALQDGVLSEKLAAIDLLSFTSIRELREAIIATIEGHQRADGRWSRECPPGDEFHFCRSKSFIMPTGLIAHDPKEFFEVLPQVSNVSLFFHFFEARLRLGRPTNDFSQWFSWRGETTLGNPPVSSSVGSTQDGIGSGDVISTFPLRTLECGSSSNLGLADTTPRSSQCPISRSSYRFHSTGWRRRSIR